MKGGQQGAIHHKMWPSASASATIRTLFPTLAMSLTPTRTFIHCLKGLTHPPDTLSSCLTSWSTVQLRCVENAPVLWVVCQHDTAPTRPTGTPLQPVACGFLRERFGLQGPSALQHSYRRELGRSVASPTTPGGGGLLSGAGTDCLRPAQRELYC